MTTRTKGTRRRPIISGLAVVLTAAAVLSFETLDKLAKGVGYTATFNLPALSDGDGPSIYLSWLLPISVDAFGFLATVAWLTPTFSPDIRWFAKRAALGDLAGSAALNALYHGMMAAEWEIKTTTWVVIGVGALPPVMVFLSLHLGALVMDDSSSEAPDEEAVDTASETAAEAPSAVAPVALPTLPDPAEVWAAIDATEAPDDEPAKRFRVARQKHPKKQAQKRASEAPAAASEKRSLTDAEAVLLLLEEHPNENPSKREAQALLKVHFNRVGSIFELADQKRSEKHLHLVPTDAAAAAN